MNRSRRFAFRQRVSAWLGVASLLGLLLLQPAHARSDPEHARASSGTETTLTLSAAGAPAPEHEAGSCQVCRAASQVRSGLCAALQRVVSPALHRPLHPLAAPLPGAAPALRNAWPRAPPAPSAA
jgi:hypothetical protein